MAGGDHGRQVTSRLPGTTAPGWPYARGPTRGAALEVGCR